MMETFVMIPEYYIYNYNIFWNTSQFVSDGVIFQTDFTEILDYLLML